MLSNKNLDALLNHDTNYAIENKSDINLISYPCFQWINMELRFIEDDCSLYLFYKKPNMNKLTQSTVLKVIESGTIAHFSAREAEAIRLMSILEQSFHSHCNIDYSYLDAIKSIAKQFNKI